MNINKTLVESEKICFNILKVKSESGKFGLLFSDDGSKISECSYLNIAYNDGVFILIGEKSISKLSIVDSKIYLTENILIYDNIKQFERGFWKVQKNGLIGLINDFGNMFLETKYGDISNFHNGFSKIRQDNLYGLMNQYYKVIVKPIYHSISNVHNNGFAKVSYRKKYGLINVNAKDFEIIKPEFNKVEVITNNGIIKAILDGKITIVFHNKIGVLKPKYEEIFDFTNDIAVVSAGGKYGIINEKGNEILEPKYDKIYNFENELAITKLNGKYGVLDIYGKEIIMPKKKMSEINNIIITLKNKLIDNKKNELCEDEIPIYNKRINEKEAISSLEKSNWIGSRKRRIWTNREGS